MQGQAKARSETLYSLCIGTQSLPKVELRMARCDWLRVDSKAHRKVCKVVFEIEKKLSATENAQLTRQIQPYPLSIRKLIWEKMLLSIQPIFML
jgi:hypothetical protein